MYLLMYCCLSFTKKCWALALVKKVNQELLGTVQTYPNQFLAGVAMLSLNNIEGSLEILEDFVVKHPEIVGVQRLSSNIKKSS